MRPDTFTITTFWLDWLLMPILLAGAWLTIRDTHHRFTSPQREGKRCVVE
jgi:hypothetical protein